VVTIGPGGDFDDPTGAWERQREIDGTGAVLVRPDQHVAWRSQGRPAEPGAAVAQALLAVLRRTAPILA
jgi:2,4-dichlorophenol 6-monooxygenase